MLIAFLVLSFFFGLAFCHASGKVAAGDRIARAQLREIDAWEARDREWLWAQESGELARQRAEKAAGLRDRIEPPWEHPDSDEAWAWECELQRRARECPLWHVDPLPGRD